MHTALTKPQIAALAATRGRPISAALAATIATVTGGCPRTVEAALDAAQHADADAAVTKVIADAVRGHRIEVLRAMDETDRTVVTLAHFGVGADHDVLLDLVDGISDVDCILDEAVAAGLVSDSFTALPDVDSALVGAVGKRRVLATATRLLEYRCKTDTLDTPTAVMMTRAGVRHPELAHFLATAASGAGTDSAALLYGYAVDAGADAIALAPQRAEIAFLLGDLQSAEQFCDSVLEQHDSVDDRQLRTAVRVAAAVAAERGMATRSSALYSWLGVERAGSDADIAAAVALTVGDRTVADAMAGGSTAPPTASSAASGLLAAGLRESVAAISTADATAATSTLMRAVSLSTGASRRATPDSAAATTILFALHSGDLARAESTAIRTVATLPPGHPQSARIALLHAWTAMLAGDVAGAQSRIDSVQIPLSHSRNQLFLHGLRVGLARRSGDSGSLSKAWDDAQDVVASYSVDLLSFLPVGELWLAAVRVGQRERVSHLLAQADTVIAQLDEPHVWSSALHWYGVQAAILAEHPAELVPHARALAQAAESNDYAAALAAAGRAWLGILQGRADVPEVEATARSLTRFGLSWDGARLASEAALRVEDTRSATTLLQVARSLRMPTSAPTADVADEPKGSLSAREAEVAELLVLGVTYREAGARLYISAKTVEHHVARIRRRLGAGSRSELLSMLRALGYGADSADV